MLERSDEAAVMSRRIRSTTAHRVSSEPNRSTAAASVVVGLTCVAAAVVPLAGVALYGRNIPLAEDWLLVAPLTGNEENLGSWFWAQNNEHRVPLPRLIYLAALSVGGGDFRSGMVVNVFVLFGLSVLAVLTARRLRRGVTRYEDVFFPLILLHLGHWPNLVWGWQLQFVTAVGLTLTLLIVTLQDRPLPTSSLVLAGVVLVLLPLCGANGVVYVVATAPWLTYEGYRASRNTDAPGKRRAGLFLVTSSLLAAVIIVAYFIGYQRATWNPPPGILFDVAATSAAFVAMGWGPAAKSQIVVGAIGSAVIVSATLLMLGARFRSTRGTFEWHRAVALCCFAAGCAALALAIGWGRAGMVHQVGMPTRYALLSAPTMIAAYYVWLLYGPGRTRSIVPLFFAVLALALLPINVRWGLNWGDWYVAGMEGVENDLLQGLPLSDIADRHGDFLLHWDRDKLLGSMHMLDDAGLGPFGKTASARDGRDSLGVTPLSPSLRK